MARILLVGVDLFLRGKLEALLPDHRFTTADGIDPPDLVIADVSRVDPDDVADNYPEVADLTSDERGRHAALFGRLIGPLS